MLRRLKEFVDGGAVQIQGLQGLATAAAASKTPPVVVDPEQPCREAQRAFKMAFAALQATRQQEIRLAGELAQMQQRLQAKKDAGHGFRTVHHRA
ncbi:MAG: hypothetical protein GY717_15870 [Rhodobacteraceae bacterium]|nr:hypothetical protein [Paracoccaceae bacterium]